MGCLWYLIKSESLSDGEKYDRLTLADRRFVSPSRKACHVQGL